MNTNNLQLKDEKFINDFNSALNIYENEYLHDDLISFLKTGSIAEKQTAVLKMDGIKNKIEADLVISNLVGCDGKIREAVSFRLSEFILTNPEYFDGYSEIFLEAIIDINGNICRNVISALKNLKSDKIFMNEFCACLLEKTLNLSKRAVLFDIQDGKYRINKQIFKLYWYLETIYEFAEFVDIDILYDILNYAKDVKDYTIREKAAYIISKLNNPKFFDIKNELLGDTNYYVLKALKGN